MNTNRWPVLMVLILACNFLAGGDCGEPINKDPGFDLWCGDSLCAWSVDQGQIRRASTWHRSDHGVEMVGNPVVISQLSRESDADCFAFELIADADEGVGLTIQMDFNDDGSVEYDHPLASNDWRPVSYLITPPTWYSSVRFKIRKSGQGRAVVAQVRVESASGCTAEPLALTDRPLGVECRTDGECASDTCTSFPMWEMWLNREEERRRCSSCRDSGDCPQDQVCGVKPGDDSSIYLECGPPSRHVVGERCVADEECESNATCCKGFCARCCGGEGCGEGEACGLGEERNETHILECGAEGRKVLGERCVFGGECATGVCCEGACSQCCGQGGCPAGTACEKRALPMLLPPWQCSPGQGKGQTGAVCLSDDDCASGFCEGPATLKVCDTDSGRCESDEECPAFFDARSCLSLGVDGGVCR